MSASKSSRRWIVGILVLGGLLVLGFFFFAGLAFMSVGAPDVKRGAVLVIRFEGDIEEASPENIFSIFAGAGSSYVTLYDLRRVVEAAVKDDRLAGVLLEIGNITSGFSSVE